MDEKILQSFEKDLKFCRDCTLLATKEAKGGNIHRARALLEVAMCMNLFIAAPRDGLNVEDVKPLAEAKKANEMIMQRVHRYTIKKLKYEHIM
jgi:hypothetical protein